MQFKWLEAIKDAQSGSLLNFNNIKLIFIYVQVCAYVQLMEHIVHFKQYWAIYLSVG